MPTDRMENRLSKMLENKLAKLNALKNVPLTIVTADVPAPSPVKNSLNMSPKEPRAPKQQV